MRWIDLIMFLESFNAAGNVKTEAQEPSLRFQEITHDAPDNIVGQLVGHDRVHVFGADSVQALRMHRLGGKGFDKTCYAIIKEGIVHSAIYVANSYNQIACDRDIPGDVAAILVAKTSQDNRSPAAFIFYSISNITNVSGVGQRLVQDLHAHLRQAFPSVIRSTLSPLRSFDDGLSGQERSVFTGMSDAAKKRSVLSHLLTGQNQVEQFHLGNGARIADIKLRAGDQSIDAVTGAPCLHMAMVNYAYDMDAAQLLANAQSFASVKQALRNSGLETQKRQDIVSSRILELVSPSLLEEIAYAQPLQQRTQTRVLGF